VVHALVRRLPDQPPHGALLLRPADHHAVPPVVGDRPDLVREPLRGGRQLREENLQASRGVAEPLGPPVRIHRVEHRSVFNHTAMHPHRKGEQHVPDVTRILDRGPHLRPRPPAQSLVADRRQQGGEGGRRLTDEGEAPVHVEVRVCQSAGRAGVVLAEKGRQVAHGFSIP